MKSLKKNTHEKWTGRHLVLIGLIVSIFLSTLVPSCTHDPGEVVDPIPIDTIGNPIDIMGEDSTVIPCDPNLVYFNEQILPILASNCAKSGCHDVTTHEKEIILNSYENVMKDQLIRPYDLNGSRIYEVITENDADDVMPPPPNQKLTTAQIALIAKWILQGAKDTTCTEVVSTCDTSAVSYAGFIAPLLTTFCTGCHSGSAPSGGITLNTYSAVQSVALSGRLVGAVNWAPGYRPMPQGSPKLSDCRIAKIKAWVNDGAANN